MFLGDGTGSVLPWLTTCLITCDSVEREPGADPSVAQLPVQVCDEGLGARSGQASRIDDSAKGKVVYNLIK